MAMFITVKAYICDEGSQVNQVRKFVIDKDFCSSYNYLVKKLFQMMPELENQAVKISWRDEDMDMITITNDEELMVALMEGKKDHLNIYVTKRRGKPNVKGDIHYGVTCDACEGAIRGNRYKCLACPDFDLCLGCEMAGKHNNHKMIRLAKPFEKTIDDELNQHSISNLHVNQNQSRLLSVNYGYNNNNNQHSKQVLKNKNLGPVYLLNDPHKKFLINAEKELTKRRLINKQLKEIPVIHMTSELKTNLIPKVGKSPRHMMKNIRPATKPLFETRLPIEEVLKGCCSNLWYEFIAEKDLKDKKTVNENIPLKSAPKTITQAENESKENLPADDASEGQVFGEEQFKESLKQVLAQIFPSSEFKFVISELDNSVKKGDSAVNDADNETNKINKDKTVETEKKSSNNETIHQTDKEDDRTSPVPLTTLAALTALANPEFVSITTTAPSTQSLPSTPVTKSRHNSPESSNISLPDNITMEDEKRAIKCNQTNLTSDVLSILEAMGLSNDEGWLTKLVEAKHGDIEKVLQTLTPTISAERFH